MMNNEYTDMTGIPAMNNEYTDMTGIPEMSDEIKEGKIKKGILIALIIVVLAGAGVLTYFLAFREVNSPENVAKHDMEAVMKNDYKSIIKNMTDEQFDTLAVVDADEMSRYGLSNGKELRSWAISHVSDLDYMLTRLISYEIKNTSHMSVSKYIEDYLGGYGDNGYYSFLDDQDEIAVVEISYVAEYEGKEYEWTEGIITYKKNDKWYSLSGLQIVDDMLRYMDERD